MACEDRTTSQWQRVLALIFWIIFLVSPLILPVIFLPAPLVAQSSSSGASTSSSPPPSPVTSSAGIPNQVQTSAQNPVFGSVPEDKPTLGILSLTFSDAIERALRQNLAGLLSQYNTVEA